jgi:hypothetical protein
MPCKPGESPHLRQAEEIDDLEAMRLARDIAKQIERLDAVPGADQGDGDPRDALDRLRQVRQLVDEAGSLRRYN